MHSGFKYFLAAVLVSVVFAAGAQAGGISLTTHDGAVSLSGTFAGFNQDAYVIIYQGQELHVPARLMTCQGADCLDFDSPKDIIQLASND